MEKTIEDIGEVGVLQMLQKYVTPDEFLSRDDDAVTVRGKQYTVVNIDGWAEITDRPPQMPLRACGYKATVNSISDVICKGAQPTDVLVSIFVPRTFKVAWLREITEGIAHACKVHGVNFRGGDLNRLDRLVIDVTSIGSSSYAPIPRHSKLERGDKVWWIGPPFGSTGMLLHYLLTGLSTESFTSQLEKYLFYPRLSLSYLKLLSKKRKYVISAADCSDGLARTLALLVEGTGMKIVLDESNVLPPQWVSDGGEEEKIFQYIFYGGEELGIVFITRGLEEIESARQIGEVVEGEEGVMISGEYIKLEGWKHF